VELERELVPDGLWEIAAPLIPPFKPRRQGGGTAPVADRKVFCAIVYALTTSCVTRALPGSEEVTAASSSESGTRRRSIIRTRDGQGITLPVIVLGLCGGGLTVIIPAASAGYGNVISSGYSFAAFSLGGLVCGLACGRRKWTASLRTRYTAATSGLVAGALLLAALSQSPLTILAVFCVGLPMTPIFVIAYLLVDERIDPSRHAEANA
jgi:hypothetical protein